MIVATRSDKHKPAELAEDEVRRRGRRRPRMVNRAAVRRQVDLTVFACHRAGTITRVGESVYRKLEHVLARELRDMVQRHPSGFRTLEAQ